MLLHYDTETTGIPIAGQPSEHPGHPHIVSLSAVLDDDQGVARRVMSVIVKPNGYRLEDFPEAFNVHGITTDVAMKYGVDLADALEQFINLARFADVLSSFSHHFDFKLLKIGCARILPTVGNAWREYLETKASICTMETAAHHLIGRKRISLKNAFFEFFKTEIQKGKHGSLPDAYASRKIYYELKERGWLPPPTPLTRKVYDTPPPDPDERPDVRRPARSRARVEAAIGAPVEELPGVA